MTQEQFDKILQARLKTIQETLAAKGDEYTHGDRLGNFKSIARLKKETSVSSLLGLVGKQIVSLFDFAKDLELLEPKFHDFSLWNEKLGDVICYMILLEAVLKDTDAAKFPDCVTAERIYSDALKRLFK